MSVPADIVNPQSQPVARRPLVISLEDALAMGLSENPDLITVRGTANVSAAAVDVASVYPWNPFVQAQFLPNGHPFVTSSVPGAAAGQANYYIWLMQRFELGHQRRYRENSAIAALGQVRWNIRLAELTNVAQTERLFFTALYQRQLRDLIADAATLSDRLVEVANRRFNAGLATGLDTTNARVAARQARRQQHLAEAAYQAALLALRQQLGMPPDVPLDLTGDLTQYEWFPVASAASRVANTAGIDPRSLAAEMAEARPDVLAARSAIAVAQGNLNLARAARIPDMQAGPIYVTADNQTQYLGFRLQRDFGVFNNGSALMNQRQTELQQQRVAYDQIRRRATYEAAAAIDRYERARGFVAEVAQEASEAPRQELSQVLGQFEAGNADIVNVLAVQNNLLQELRSYLDLVNEVAQSAALVTQATALPPERLFALRPPKFPASAP
jgi:outer membrane protein TolC